MSKQSQYDIIASNKMERLNEPEINLQIVLCFLQQLEKMTEQERKEILKVIQIINNPIYITK